jgi:hypothetical protein
MTDNASGKHDLVWLCSIDADDTTMNNDAIREEAAKLGITLHLGKSKNKIEAINRDMDKSGDWEILVNCADDMRAIIKGWDQIVVDQMPSLDAGLWFPDGNRRDLCTLCIFGRPILERMGGHIYHPAFESVYADNYYHYVMERWGRLLLVDRADVFKHEWKTANDDALMARNENRTTYRNDRGRWENLKSHFNRTGSFL